MNRNQQDLQRLSKALQAGNWERVIADGSELGDRLGEHPALLHMVGLALHQLGRSEEALGYLQKAAAISPRETALQVNLGAVHLALGQFVEAEASARRALATDPGSLGGRINLALALEGRDRNEEAIALLKRILASDPARMVARRALVRTLLRVGQIEEAMTWAPGDLCSVDPPLADLRARAHAMAGRWEDAARHWESRCKADNVDADALVSLAHCLSELGRGGEGIEQLRRALDQVPGHVEARNLLANALLMQGDVDEAIALHDANWQEATSRADLHSNRLIALQHDPGVGPERLYREHCAWAERHAAGVAPRPRSAGRAAGGTRTTVAFVSPRFHEGPVATFLLHLLPHLRICGLRCVLYQNSHVQDAATTAFAAACDAWRVSADWSDGRFCEQVRNDGVDVLIELAGHAPGNRLAALASRPAPLQAAWLDYFSTTGHPAVDVLITDHYLSPPGSDRYFSETLAYLPTGRLCYGPPSAAPEPGTPNTEAGVFGAFNRISKLNDDVARLWSQLLRELPAWKLRIRASATADPVHRERLVERFLRFGIDPNRLELERFGSYAETLESWRSVDIALDPFPFSGCATSCDALWMGVPVVTLAGETMVGRQTGSLLHQLDRQSWIARTPQDYLSIAKRLACDHAERVRQRSELRHRVLMRIADERSFAADLSGLILGLTD